MTAEEHMHTWEQIGGCTHPHQTGTQGGRAFRCHSCGQYGHQITMYACGVRRKRGERVLPSHCPGLDVEDWETWWESESEAIAVGESAQ